MHSIQQTIIAAITACLALAPSAAAYEVMRIRPEQCEAEGLLETNNPQSPRAKYCSLLLHEIRVNSGDDGITVDQCRENLVGESVNPQTAISIYCNYLYELENDEEDRRRRHNNGNSNDPDDEDLTLEECRKSFFEQVYPPTRAQQHCDKLEKAAAKEKQKKKKKKGTKGDDVDKLTPEECRNIGFLAVEPKTAAQIRCEELLGEREHSTDSDFNIDSQDPQ